MSVFLSIIYLVFVCGTINTFNCLYNGKIIKGRETCKEITHTTQIHIPTHTVGRSSLAEKYIPSSNSEN